MPIRHVHLLGGCSMAWSSIPLHQVYYAEVGASFAHGVACRDRPPGHALPFCTLWQHLLDTVVGKALHRLVNFTAGCFFLPVPNASSSILVSLPGLTWGELAVCPGRFAGPCLLHCVPGALCIRVG